MRLSNYNITLLASMIFWTGCDPVHQAQKADEEVAAIMGVRASDPRWKQAALAPMPPDHSRLDAFAKLEDDPASFALLERLAGRRLPNDWLLPEFLEDTGWLEALPTDESGRVVLDMRSAVETGVRNSRDFQLRREDLFLSALDVSGEQFLFRPRLFAGGGIDMENREDGISNPGKDAAGTLDAQIRLGLATGGEFVLNLANTFLWDLSGGSGETASGLLGFRFVQPLLQEGGRAWALFDLAQAERTFLSNLRRMYQYQQSYYVEVVAGQRLSSGPTQGSGGGIAGNGGSRVGGFLGFLQDRQQIRNLEANVARLRDSHAQLLAAFEAGRINNRLQVDQARQALFNAQSRLLQEQARQASALDGFKMDLGLPPTLEVNLQDPVLDRFALVNPEVTKLQDAVGDVLDVVRSPDNAGDIEVLAEGLSRIRELEKGVRVALVGLQEDLNSLQESLPVRKLQLSNLEERSEVNDVGLDVSLFSVDLLIETRNRLNSNHDRLKLEFARLWPEIVNLEVSLEEKELAVVRQEFVDLCTNLSGLLLELSLDQAAARLEGVAMVSADIEADSALTIARENRLDWMNERAILHDEWRRTGLYRNALRSSLDLVLAGDLQAGDGDRSPLRFHRRRGLLKGGIRLDTPVTRRLERNAYRESLIRFDRARRKYIAYEDAVALQLRDTLRTLRLEQLNFELRRAAVRVAIDQVDLARLRLNQPPQPGKGGQFGATTARDLVSALRDLLDAQNEFLEAWVGYEVLRMILDFQLGTMRVDDQNLWLDPAEPQ